MQNFWIDAHHHLWRYSAEEYPWMSERMDVLRRDFDIAELQTLANEHSVHGDSRGAGTADARRD